MEPINYILDVKSPIEQAMIGYGLGRQDIEQTQVMQEREQLMDVRAAQEARAAAQEEERRATAASQRAQAEAMQSQLMDLREMAMDGTLTSEALDKFALANASTFDEFRTAFQNVSEPRRQADVQFGLQLSTSLLRGNTDAGLSIIDTRIAAAENTGTPASLEEAQRLRVIRAEAEADPIGFATANLANLTAQGAIDSTAMKTVLEASGQKGEPEGASPLGKIAQDVNSGLIPKSVLDVAIAVDKTAQAGEMTPAAKAAEEKQIRGEWTKLYSGVSDARRNYSIIETSAADQSGAGDIALVTSFMKMLDPTSVVRETEFATARDSGGLFATLQSYVSRIEDGKFLTPKQRTDFKRLSNQYLKAAEDQVAPVRSSYEKLIGNYGLNPENIFVIGNEPAAPPTALPESFTTSKAVTDAAAAQGTTPEAMWNVMTPEQRAVYGG